MEPARSTRESDVEEALAVRKETREAMRCFVSRGVERRDLAGSAPGPLTANSGPSPAGAKTIVPLRDHDAPRPLGASHTVSTPPPTRARLILPSAKNPIHRLSGDQNGREALSVPGIARPSRAPSGRVQS